MKQCEFSSTYLLSHKMCPQVTHLWLPSMKYIPTSRQPRGEPSHETLRAFSHDHFALIAVKSRFFSLYSIISPKNEHHVMTRGDSKDASSGLASGPNPAGATIMCIVDRTTDPTVLIKTHVTVPIHSEKCLTQFVSCLWHVIIDQSSLQAVKAKDTNWHLI